DVRHRPEACWSRQAKRDADDDASEDCDAEADRDALEARHDVRPELREEPHVLELRQDRRGRRELRIVPIDGPELPGGDDRDRHRDLRSELDRLIPAAAHAVTARCEGCQRNARRSAAVETTWIARPRNPVASA